METAKPGYKKTKIGWIPEEWSIKHFVDIGSKNKPVVKAGPFGSSLKKEFYVSNGFKIYGQEQVISGDAFLGNYYIDEKRYESLKSCKVEPGDILLSLVGTLGKVLVLPKNAEKGIINPRLLKITICKEKYDPEFVAFYLKSPKTNQILERWAQGGTMGVLNASIFKALLIPLPPLPEQRKIAEILSTWDKAIEQTQKLGELLKLRKKGLMQQLLTGEIRLKGFSNKWKNYSLGEIAKRVTTKNVELKDNVVTISAQRGFIRQEEFFNKRVASDTLSGYYLIKKGQFAYNKSYSNGYPMGAFKRLDNYENAVVTTLYICFELNKSVDSDFILNYFEGGLMIPNLMKIAQEGGRAHGLLNISLEDFFSLDLHLPPLEEQILIARIITTADNEIKAQEKYLEQLQSQKKGLMQQLLTGQKRVKV